MICRLHNLSLALNYFSVGRGSFTFFAHPLLFAAAAAVVPAVGDKCAAAQPRRIVAALIMQSLERRRIGLIKFKPRLHLERCPVCPLRHLPGPSLLHA